MLRNTLWKDCPYTYMWMIYLIVGYQISRCPILILSQVPSRL